MTQEEHMTSTPTKVDYDIMLPLVCEEHYEYSALLCCPLSYNRILCTALK